MKVWCEDCKKYHYSKTVIPKDAVEEAQWKKEAIAEPPLGKYVLRKGDLVKIDDQVAITSPASPIRR